MFKLMFLFVVFVGVFSAPQSNVQVSDARVALMLEMKDFMAVMPMQQIYNTLLDHLNNDEEMQAALKYLQSREYKRDMRALLSRPSVKELRMKYTEAGLDIERYEKIINDIINGLSITVPEDTARSFRSFLADIDELIPYEKLVQILEDKMDNSPVFIRFYNTISTHEMQMLFEKMLNSPEFKQVAQSMEELDVPISQHISVLYSFFGWNQQSNSPNDL